MMIFIIIQEIYTFFFGMTQLLNSQFNNRISFDDSNDQIHITNKLDQ